MGWVGPGLGVGPAGLLVRALGKYLDPVGNRDRYGPQNPAHGVLKFPETVLVACWRKGSRVTCRLAVQFKMCLCKASWTKYTIGVCGWELTSVVTLSRFELTTGFLLGPADDRRVLPSLLPQKQIFLMGNLCCQYTGCARRRHPGLQSNADIQGVLGEGILGYKVMLLLYRVCLVKAPWVTK